MLAFHTLDVFTDTTFAGNPLAVVLGADGLTTAQMQTIAREFNLSETIFVQAPRDPAHTARVRIFFPTAEIPFAGHPTIGCAILLGEGALGDAPLRLVLEEEAGLVPVTLTRDGDRIVAELTAPVVPHGAPVAAGGLEAGLIAAALGLWRGDIGFGAHRPGVWQGGPAFLYVPVRDLAALGRAQPQQPEWDRLMDLCGVDSAYLYTPGADADYRARMFSPGAGIPEDPATGSASAILAAQLWAARAIAPGETRLALRQGVEMGRPSQIALTVVCDQAGVQSVRVAGTAVRISEGRIRIPV
ncbi:trans-2,3-dihydro-3-hydroxyanthranilate isomerase [Pseudorhodobacter antarcticus]|jgi:trans-2,3-dihydro-3-hydroxyanthranilate isomerase|uniref:Trans-2,3-dihydro-3-hydroxyanthranilate isomerase n=1 Tax=Pseudorhodobacter antarcticus TaxID=1077947 RepID=A0A1H8AEE5_9RHOB|nr:PhzF family phenazine biosynthesis protein [Pseudorhodobacter antarcticus]SEM69222.1 trans-2,3-dihydro-3-hydroxyanthranilate isomerase [Pseudorhodobacter antarcticus]